MIILGNLGLVLVGMLLGISGGGSSIFLVPLLVYGFGLSAQMAIQESLLVIGLNALFGGWSYQKKGLICKKSIFHFGIPALFMVILTRQFLVSQLPLVLFENSIFSIEKERFLMLLFAFFMLFSGFWMILKKENIAPSEPIKVSVFEPLKIIFAALMIGFLSGLLGAGGGFLLVPALMHWKKLDIKKAVGSSLWIIALNALIGFGVRFEEEEMDLFRMLSLLFFTFLGMGIGTYYAEKINPKSIKIIFSTGVFLTSFYILFKIFTSM